MKNKEIGMRIKQRREETGISVIDISNVTGLSKATIHRYENGEIKNIKFPVIELIAKYLDVSTLWLIGESDKKGKYEEDTPNELTLTVEYFLRTLENGEVTINHKIINPDKKKTLLSIMKAFKIIMHEK